MVCAWDNRLSYRVFWCFRGPGRREGCENGHYPGPMFGIQHGILRGQWPTTPEERERLRAMTPLLQGGRYGAVLGGDAGRPKGSPD